MTFLHARQPQIPTAVRFTESYRSIMLKTCSTDNRGQDAYLAAEGASVACVLRHFHLFDLLTQGGTVTLREGRFSTGITLQPSEGTYSAVLSGDADLTSAFRLRVMLGTKLHSKALKKHTIFNFGS